MGFAKEGRHWYHEQADVSIEVPDDVLAGDPNRVTEVELDDLNVRIIGVEDLILDRLRAVVHWKSTLDEEMVRSLIASQRDEMDWTYLREKIASEKDLGDAFTAAVKSLGIDDS